MAFETIFSKATFSDFFLMYYGAKQKQEAPKQFCLTSLFRLFLGGKRKFGEFQHRPVLEEQEGSLLVSMLLLLAAILSEIMSFLGNQQQLYLRQQMSQVGKVYSAITHR